MIFTIFPFHAFDNKTTLPRGQHQSALWNDWLLMFTPSRMLLLLWGWAHVFGLRNALLLWQLLDSKHGHWLCKRVYNMASHGSMCCRLVDRHNGTRKAFTHFTKLFAPCARGKMQRWYSSATQKENQLEVAESTPVPNFAAASKTRSRQVTLLNSSLHACEI